MEFNNSEFGVENKMNIRLAVTDDLNNIAEVYRYNHINTYKGLLSDKYLSNLTLDYCRDKWEKYAEDTRKRIWVAYEADIFLGFVAGMEDSQLPDTWYLDSLHVTERARGKGIGTALIKTIGKYANENNYAKMSICIVQGNDSASNLYKKLGAEHFSYFCDDFCGTVSDSEKLLWKNLKIFE